MLHPDKLKNISAIYRVYQRRRGFAIEVLQSAVFRRWAGL